jgi:diguanylate cyclase (GGDEF)-like protein
LKDITQQKHASDSLEHLAYFDELTSLGNRRRFRQQVTESIPLCRSQACLFLISLERLQPITNSSGYEIVDELMVASAQRIEYWISQQGTQQSHLARFDSYGFSVWLEMAEPEEVGVLARDLVSAFEQALYTEDGPFYLDVSLGVSCFPQDGSAYDDLLKNADAARARASASSASSAFCLFSQDMFLREQDWLAMEQALREAQQKGELALFYQPQVDMDTLDLLGFEALLRWRHDTRGMVSPAEFIPLAEQSGLILPIGEWVFKTACQQAKIWFDQGFEQLKIAVNISARQFQDHQFIDRIQSVLELTGVDPCMIELEITESVMLDNQAQAIDLLKQLKALGLGLAMDDFGTGYSSLSYLTQFPMDKLKIDRSFVTDVQDSEDKIAVVRTIIDLARHLGLRVIAEGVETDAERQLLLRYHCQEMQGFYFSPAVDAEQAGSFLHDTGQQSQRFP